MSMPSDVNPDITEAMERTARPPRPAKSQLTAEQTGWAVAAFVAFLGVTYFGPALAQWRRRPPLKERLAQRAQAAREDARRRARAARDEARRQARKAGGRMKKAEGSLRKRARRLGGDSIWR